MTKQTLVESKELGVHLQKEAKKMRQRGAYAMARNYCARGWPISWVLAIAALAFPKKGSKIDTYA
jgi:hypothetical protein